MTVPDAATQSMTIMQQLVSTLQKIIGRLIKWFVGLVRYFFRHIEVFAIVALICFAVFKQYVEPKSQSLEQVVESGVLRVLITDEPDSQYVFNKQHYGFEYELLEMFAESLGAELSLQVVPYGELFTLLDTGRADIAVGGILDSPFVRRVAQPTIPWYQAQTIVAYRRGTKRPLDLDDLAQREVLTSSRYYQIEQLNSLRLVDDHRSEYELLTAVDSGDAEFALSTNYRVLNAKHYLPHINRSFILPDKLDVVWVLPKQHDPALEQRLNVFLQNALDKKLPSLLAETYFALPQRLSIYDALVVHEKIDSVLPNFEYKFRTAARKAGMDWHLLAGISYQESKWSNDAKSPTGVRGIMQLTTQTAEFLGVDDRLDMTQSIDAAARYLVQLKSRLPKDIKEPERTWFAVGSYNMGLKHIRRAYLKAKRLGYDQTQWSVVSELLPTLYDEPYSKGRQAKHYVERVQIFTDIMRFYDLHQRNGRLLTKGWFNDIF